MRLSGSEAKIGGGSTTAQNKLLLDQWERVIDLTIDLRDLGREFGYLSDRFDGNPWRREAE